jgi:hypothetical protein
MCVLGNRSSDEKTYHAICIAAGWIFDSNFKKKFPLSNESLNLCSSSSEQATEFVEVTSKRCYAEKKRLNHSYTFNNY